jgi:hypothetical protein
MYNLHFKHNGIKVQTLCWSLIITVDFTTAYHKYLSTARWIHLTSYVLKINFNIILTYCIYPCLYLQRCISPSGFQNKILCAFLISPKRTACSVRPIISDQISLIKFNKDYSVQLVLGTKLAWRLGPNTGPAPQRLAAHFGIASGHARFISTSFIILLINFMVRSLICRQRHQMYRKEISAGYGTPHYATFTSLLSLSNPTRVRISTSVSCSYAFSIDNAFAGHSSYIKQCLLEGTHWWFNPLAPEFSIQF